MDLRTSLLLGELAFYSIWHNNPILHLYPMHPADSIGFILYSIPFFLLLSSKPAWRGGVRKIFIFKGYHAHSLSPRRGTTSNLLDTELVKLGLQLLQLSVEVILVLSPELTSLDLGCRLETHTQKKKTRQLNSSCHK